MAQHKARDLKAWVTFLGDDQVALDPKVVKWGSHHAVRNVPLGVFEDSGGPPTYRLSPDADVTVLLFVNEKVASAFAFRSNELTDAQIDKVLAALPKLLPRN